MTEDTQSIQPAALSDTTAKTLNEIRNILAAHKERNNLKLGAIDKDLPNVISVLPRLPSKHDTLNFERPELFNIVVRDGQCFAQSQDDNALVLLSGISCKISG